MEKRDRLAQKIVRVISDFERKQMSLTPESISVSLEPDTLIVTLKGLTSPAERQLVRAGGSRELLEKFYAEVFASTRASLEAAVEEILCQRVERSRLSLDSESGDGVILFRLQPCSRQRKS